jgi:hypothetical protein
VVDLQVPVENEVSPDESYTLEELLTLVFNHIDHFVVDETNGYVEPEWLDQPMVEGPWTPYDMVVELDDGRTVSLWEPSDDHSTFHIHWFGWWEYSPTDPRAQLDLCRAIALWWEPLARFGFLEVWLPDDEDPTDFEYWNVEPDDDPTWNELWAETFSLRGVRAGIRDLDAAGWSLDTGPVPSRRDGGPNISVDMRFSFEVVGSDADCRNNDVDFVLKVPLATETLEQVFRRSQNGESINDVVEELTGSATILTLRGDEDQREEVFRGLITELFQRSI